MPDYSRYEFIKVEKAERVATVTLNRPDRLNAVNPGLHHELMTIWNDLAEDREVNAIILTGAGRAFCAGDGGAVIWPLLIGPARAKEFLMRGHFVNGADAFKMGMVNYAVAPEQVMAKARELAQELADGPTWAIRWSKLEVNKWLKQQTN